MRRLTTRVLIGPAESAVPIPVGPVAAPAAPPVPEDWWGETGWYRYYLFLAFTAFAHMANAIATIALIQKSGHNWQSTVCYTYTSWKPDVPGIDCFKSYNGTVNKCTQTLSYYRVGTVSPGYMVVAFFILSFAFQLYPLLPETRITPGFLKYKDTLVLERRQPLRFIEYSISSTLMVWTILVLLGNVDLWLIMAVGAANWSMNIFGMLQETSANMVPHFAGWIPFVAVWTIVLTQFDRGMNESAHVPTAVKAIPSVMMVLFFLFGVNQTGSELNKLGHTRFTWTYKRSEVNYTILSLVAKTILAWMIYGGVTARKPESLTQLGLC